MPPRNSLSSNWLIVTIALLTAIGPFSVDTYLPSFPSIESEFGITRAVLSQSLGFYLFAAAISTLFWGPLSDRIGRRWVILGTLAIYLAASIGCALATSSHAFLSFRILQGLAASGGMVAGRAMIRDAHDTDEAHRAMSYVMMLFALAPAIAPVAGAWLHDTFGWRSVFYFLAVYAVAIGALTLRFLGETLAREHRQSFHPMAVSRLYTRILMHRRFQATVFSLSACFGGLFLYIAGSPTVIYNFLGLDGGHFGWLFVPMTGGIVVGAFVSGKLSHRWGATRLITLGLALMAVAVLANLVQATVIIASLMTMVVPQALYAFGIALALPGFTILALDCFPANRGAASAVQSFVQLMATALVASALLPALVASAAGFALAQAALLLSSGLLWCWARCYPVDVEPSLPQEN